MIINQILFRLFAGKTPPPGRQENIQKVARWRLYLSFTLPGDEKAILVHLHLTVGLKDVRVLQRGIKQFLEEDSSITGFYLTWQDIKQPTSLTHTEFTQPDKQMER